MLWWLVTIGLLLLAAVQTVRAWWWHCRFVEERLYGPGYDRRRPVILKNRGTGRGREVVEVTGEWPDVI